MLYQHIVQIILLGSKRKIFPGFEVNKGPGNRRDKEKYLWIKKVLKCQKTEIMEEPTDHS